MGAYSDRVIADGASYYWRLGETVGTTAVDEKGLANGTISGGVTLNQPGAINDGTTAMTFDGTTGKITTTVPVSMPVPVTFEVWLRTTETIRRPMMGLDILNAPVFGVLNKRLLLSAAGASVVGIKIVADGTWHHAVAVLTGTTASLYVDGVLDKTVAVALPGGATGVFNLGADPAGTMPRGFWLGRLDDLALYPRALGLPDIAAHHATAQPTLVQSSRPISWGMFKQRLTRV